MLILAQFLRRISLWHNLSELGGGTTDDIPYSDHRFLPEQAHSEQVADRDLGR